MVDRSGGGCLHNVVPVGVCGQYVCKKSKRAIKRGRKLERRCHSLLFHFAHMY